MGHLGTGQLYDDLRRLYPQVRTRPIFAPIDVNDPFETLRELLVSQSRSATMVAGGMVWPAISNSGWMRSTSRSTAMRLPRTRSLTGIAIAEQALGYLSEELKRVVVRFRPRYSRP